MQKKTSFHDYNLQQIEYRKNIPHHDKGLYDILPAKILNGKTLKAFLLRSATRLFSLFVFNTVLEILARAVNQEK